LREKLAQGEQMGINKVWELEEMLRKQEEEMRSGQFYPITVEESDCLVLL